MTAKQLKAAFYYKTPVFSDDKEHPVKLGYVTEVIYSLSDSGKRKTAGRIQPWDNSKSTEPVSCRHIHYKGLLIVPPKRHNDIKKEGETLKHCVATYAKRVATGETIILFVRKADEPDKPYFTLNIDPETYDFVQCRGLKNCHYPNEVKTLLARWYQEKIEPLRRSQQQCLKTAS